MVRKGGTEPTGGFRGYGCQIYGLVSAVYRTGEVEHTLDDVPAANGLFLDYLLSSFGPGRLRPPRPRPGQQPPSRLVAGRTGSLNFLSSGTVVLHMKRAWRDGTTQVAF